jgi:hypothetical protein
VKCLPSECVGPTEDERSAFEAPEKILDWLYLVLENETLCSSLVTDVHHYVDPERLVLTTPAGLFALKIEKVA